MEEAVDHAKSLDEVIAHASPGLLEHIPLHEEFDEMRNKKLCLMGNAHAATR